MDTGRLFHRISINAAWSIVAGLLMTFSLPGRTPPAPFGLTPNSRQIEWFHREFQAFIHFGPNTFQNVEWGDGKADPNVFNPTALDCNQWCRVFRKAGIRAAILTIKHHDGFCLWPTQQTSYCVRNSSWKGGKGDVLKEFTDACKASGIKAAIYLSPWDRHEELSGALHPMGTKAYVDYYCNQIVELCKDKPYGSLYEIWQDGAGNINDLTEADYRKWTDTLHKYMPECVVWTTKRSYKNGDVRWVGNEGGTAGDPCWSTINGIDVLNENTPVMNRGDVNGDMYLPAETNVSIRPGWFYHANEQPKSVAQLWDLYFTSVARNTVWLLNFPPDQRGLIPAADSASAAELGARIYGTFRTNLLVGATATALHCRGAGFEPANMLDDCEGTYFASADENKTDTVVFAVSSPITFDCIMLQEVIQLGHRTLNWSVDYSTNGASWTTIQAANNKQCIGYKRLVKWSPAVTAAQVRLRITNGRACPAIHTFGVYKQAQVAPPDDWDGLSHVKESCVVGIVHPPKVMKKASQPTLITGNRIVLPSVFKSGSSLITLSFFDYRGRCVRRMHFSEDDFLRKIAAPALKAGYYVVTFSNGKTVVQQKYTGTGIGYERRR